MANTAAATSVIIGGKNNQNKVLIQTMGEEPQNQSANNRKAKNNQMTAGEIAHQRKKLQ